MKSYVKISDLFYQRERRKVLKQNKKMVLEHITAMFEDGGVEDFSIYELVDIELVKEGKQKFLRLYVDKEGGISHDDCVLISRKLGMILDEKDLIKEAYILEVSSPGIERPLKKLKDFIRFAGREVEVKLYAPLEGLGLKVIVGIIESVEDNDVRIKLEDKDEVVSIPFDKIASSKLVFRF